MTIGIYSIGIMVFKQVEIFNGELLAQLFIPKSSNKHHLSAETKEAFYKKLINYMEKEKPYLDGDLRMVKLADILGFSSHLLSQLINEKSNKNFNQFVNEYRLKEAEKLLLDNSISNNIKTIYFSAGFNNKATFYKAFKNKFGCTPSEFKNKKRKIERISN